MVYAVIDSNVLVSALFSTLPDSATVIIREKIVQGVIIPLYNDEILEEYRTVLSRPKFGFPDYLVKQILDIIILQGIPLERTKTDEVFTDQDDIVFYEIALSMEGSYLVTGNTRHFPQSPIVVTPAEMLTILEKNI